MRIFSALSQHVHMHHRPTVHHKEIAPVQTDVVELTPLTKTGRVLESKAPAVAPPNREESMKLAAPVAGFLLACAAALLASHRDK